MTTEYTLPIMELVKIPVLTRSIFFAPTFCPAYVAIVEPSASNGQQQNMEILPAAVTDATAVPYLVFCHYAPYDFMLRPAETPKKGIPEPLFNLVYHDCVIEPWMMDRVSKDEDYMLYALLAGGAPYLVRDGTYPNTDGAFDGEKISLEEMTERCRVVTELHEKTALLELVRHECMTADGSVQKSEFSDGTYVICDFAEQIYEIGYGA